MKKVMTGIVLLAMMLELAACAKSEAVTVSGIVMSVDGTKVALMEMTDISARGEHPDMPQGGENFDPGSFGSNMPENFDPENMPEGFERGDFDPENMPEGFTDGAKLPEGETIEIDIADAHISVEVDGVREGGSLDSLRPGASVTITLDKKGKATSVIVSTMSEFGDFSAKIDP